MKFIERLTPDVAQYQVHTWEIGGKAGKIFTMGKCNNSSVLVGSNPTSHARKWYKNAGAARCEACRNIGTWCNGSTADFGSANSGSSPFVPTKL